MTKRQITEKQISLLEFIRNQKVHVGTTPTFKQMRQHMNVVSNQSIILLLRSLENEGYLKKESGKARSIELTEKANGYNQNILHKNEKLTASVPFFHSNSTISSQPIITIKHIGNGILVSNMDIPMLKGGENEGTR